VYFGQNILQYKDSMIQDMARMVAVPSVCGPEEPGKPFGRESARALNLILQIAEEMGFATQNVGNYAGHAEYGEGSDIAAVITHVDVVPAAGDWDTDPFHLTQKGNLYFGRGVADDKGAAVAALYCLKALKDRGVTGKRRIRAIFGAGEELASNDLEMYFSQESMPVMAFTPDSEYGICNREKGILRVRFTGGENASKAVRRFEAGTVVNAVPALAEAVVSNSGSLKARLESAAKSAEGEFRFAETEDGIKITSVGKASHAMQPQAGFNAASHLIALLSKALSKDELGGFLGFLDRAIGTEIDGASLGVKGSDEASGPLTLNLGIVRVDDSSSEADIDIRYPVTCNGDEIFETIRKKAGEEGEKAELLHGNKPLYFPADHPLVHLLQDAYRTVKGVPAELYATGGGTYARSVPGRAVAFGPFFPDEPDRGLHNKNEHIDIGCFMEHAQICLEAMYRMMTN
jgi:succinyl-diaminopimelate desuccinylase